MRPHLPPPSRATLLSAALLLMLVLSACVSHEARRTPPQTEWLTAWMSAPSWKPQTLKDNETASFSNQSVRQDVRIGSAAEHLRLRLTNELGDEPVSVGRVQMARLRPDGKLDSPVTVRFGSQESFTLQPHKALISDTVALQFPALADLAISVYYPGSVQPIAHRLMVRVASGPEIPDTSVPPMRGPALISAVQVAADPATAPAVIVAFGDSITEGAGSHVPHGDWPSLLAQRLEQICPGGYIVLNAGISGNQLLADGGSPAGLSRLDRDVLSVGSVSQVIVLEGINDIRHIDTTGQADVVDRLAAAYRQIVASLHSHNIKVIGATLTPYKGTARQTALGLDSVARLNGLIRDGRIFDGVIDFYAAIEDPADPGRMRAEMSSGDWLHPGDSGYAAMVAALPTTLFPCRSAAPQRPGGR